jgi:PTH2 family peptidyl-tRNA hydrolase
MLPQVKQVIVVRTDLGMSPGKVAAQVGHGVLKFLEENEGPLNCGLQPYSTWFAQGATKVILGCSSEAELLALYENALLSGVECHLVVDEGRTEIAAGSTTVLAIGPDTSDRIDPITRHLRLYR